MEGNQAGVRNKTSLGTPRMSGDADALLRDGMRKKLMELPLMQPQVIPGRPDLVVELREYQPNEHGVRKAKRELPFLFSSFSQPPELLDYLQYAVTAQGGWGEEFEDFRGFRVAVLLPCKQEVVYNTHGKAALECASVTSLSDDVQECSTDSDLALEDHPVKVRVIVPPLANKACQTSHGAVRLAVESRESRSKPRKTSIQGISGTFARLTASRFGRPVSCATIRGTPDFLEIPFWATSAEKRRKGYARALLQGIEEIARNIGANELLLPSAREPEVKAVWEHLGFTPLVPDFPRLGSPFTVRLANATELVKKIPPPPSMVKLLVKHRELSHVALAKIDDEEGGSNHNKLSN